MKNIKYLILLAIAFNIIACQPRPKTEDELNATQVSIYLRDKNIDSAVIILDNFSDTPQGYLYKSMCENLICNILNKKPLRDTCLTQKLIDDMAQNYYKAYQIDSMFTISLLIGNNTNTQSFEKKIIWHQQHFQTLKNN